MFQQTTRILEIEFFLIADFRSVNLDVIEAVGNKCGSIGWLFLQSQASELSTRSYKTP